MALRQILSTIF